MNWINLRVETLRAPEYLGSDPVCRATWLNVLAYCCHQENGGRIKNARNWNDRQWQQTCGVLAEEVAHAVQLFQWDGTDVLVWMYPLDKEKEVKMKSKAGLETAEKRWGKKKKPNRVKGNSATDGATSSVNSSATNSASSSPDAEGKGKEVERNEKEQPPTPSSPPATGRKEKRKDTTPTTPQALRVAAIFGRRPTTVWTGDEIEKYRKIGPIEEDDLALVEAFYSAPDDNPDKPLYHRTTLEVFLNNFQGEMDKARKWRRSLNGHVKANNGYKIVTQ